MIKKTNIEKTNYADLFPADLSKQLLDSFKPQFESAERLRVQLEEVYKSQNFINSNFSHSFFHGIEDQVKILNSIGENFLQQNHSAIENIAKSIEPLQQSLINQAQLITNEYSRQIMPQIFDFASISSELFSGIKLLEKNISDTFSKDILRIQNMVSSFDISQITDQIKNLQNAQSQLSFGQNVMLNITEINKEHHINHITQEIENLLVQQISKNKPSYVGSLFFNNLLFLLFGMIFTVYIGKIHEQTIINIILESEKRIVNKIDSITIKKIGLSRQFYIVKTKLNVRSGPSSSSSKIDVLYQNNKVQYIKKNGKWFYIEYFDFIDGLPKTGWVYSKYLINQREN